MADDMSSISKDGANEQVPSLTSSHTRSISMQDLFRQAFMFSRSHSWYKHIRRPRDVHALLYEHGEDKYKLAIYWTDDGYVSSCEKSDHLMPKVAFSDTMKEIAAKYPVTVSHKLGGHEFDNILNVHERYSQYLDYLKKQGLADPDAIDLPILAREVLAASIPKDLLLPDTLHDRLGGHEKWRLVGLIAHAACNIALELGIPVS